MTQGIIGLREWAASMNSDITWGFASKSQTLTAAV